jgi:PHS family inorganic phosphate transporter-like MFS transporter
MPGYIAAILPLDRIGRKSIQILGFAMMTLTFLLVGPIPSVTTTLAPFLVLHGISYSFTKFGPN